ncbi:MAG: DUF3883 domain-containing protein, partial [Bacteroidaceae bacterium]|nr:DUF3883 domain-containing protein [Bacteroidaceae bacterium]
THIGLSIDSLTFMGDNKTEYSAMLVYNDYCDILSCEIAKILRASGRLDAPKISMGRKPDNVVSKIRAFAKKKENKSFYLLWFGLDSLTPVFVLLEEGSNDYNYLDKYCYFSNLKDKKIVILEHGDINYSQILDFIKTRLEKVTIDLQKDLELSVEVDSDNPKFKDVDIRKARKYIHDIGSQGENLIDAYLERKKFEKEIEEYEWMNKNGEQGKPYDFFIKYSNGLQQWIDVKTTEHEFEQAVIISKNEIKFITEKRGQEYAIFRVYSLKELQAKLKVCTDCLMYIKKMYRDVDYITQSMSDYKAAIINYKIAFEPNPSSFKTISDEIDIQFSPSIDSPTKQYLLIPQNLNRAAESS